MQFKIYFLDCPDVGKNDAQHVKFRLHAEPEDNIFKLARFHVSKNNETKVVL